MNLDLTGKNAFVGGSSRGIGLAVAKELATLGANVILVGRDEEKLDTELSDLDTSKGQMHQYIVLDYAEPEKVAGAIKNLTKELKVIHVLVNNTGGPAPGPVHKAELPELLDAFSKHLLVNQLLVKEVIEGMKSVSYGRIINIISTSVKQPLAGLGVSNTIRGAVANWSKTLAMELGQYGITVNNVLPGATQTDRLESIISNKSKKLHKSEDDVQEEMLSEIPAGRFAKPEELAYAVAFLASPSASYINGINVPVDGGRTGCL